MRERVACSENRNREYGHFGVTNLLFSLLRMIEAHEAYPEALTRKYESCVHSQPF